MRHALAQLRIEYRRWIVVRPHLAGADRGILHVRPIANVLPQGLDVIDRQWVKQLVKPTES